jgi:EAL domain-containing protein (putative c-di-GMP-specific phosphodiesterase class I)/CheY-like chemotaxis protein
MIKLSILIVDDHPLQALVLENNLKSIGVEHVSSVYSGFQALEAIKEHQFDVVFCDLDMPEMDGIQLLTALKEHEYGGGVVILSALDLVVLSTVGSICKKLDFSFTEIMTKPAMVNDLLPIIKGIDAQINKQEFKYISNSFQYHIDISIYDVLQALSCGEIKNYYQPQVDFTSGNIVSVEILARWMHPIYGLMSPAEFLPIIEKNNLTDELFDVVMTNALSDYSQGLLPYPSSINVTQESLEKADFSKRFLTMCHNHKVKPALFTVELTEREAFSNSITLLENLTRLRINQVGVSIDDFGTGYSSLMKLSQLPFSEVKVDRSFVSTCLTNHANKIIVDFSCALVKKMNMIIVAEGVEDEATWLYLKDVGFDLCQGYYTGKPMPIEVLKIVSELERSK